MSKIDFCNLLFRYIGDGFTILDIETETFIYTYDFEEDNLLLSKSHFTLSSSGMLSFKIEYEDVKDIRC